MKIYYHMKKMIKEIFTFGDTEIEKKIFYRHGTPIFIFIYSVEKNSKTFDYLYNDHKVKPLHIKLSKTSAYVKSYYG